MKNPQSKKPDFTVFVVIGVGVLAFCLGLLVRPLFWQEGDSGAEISVGKTAKKPQIRHWTCSMHPRIQRGEKGLCPICEMELIPVLEEEGGGERKVAPLRRLKLSPTAVALAEIETAPAEYKVVEAEVRMVGKIAYDETRLSYVTAWVPGRIDRLFVDYTGITVREGDHMVYLYSPELYQAQEELLEAAKAVKAIESKSSPASLQRARRTLEAAGEKIRLWGLTEGQVEEIKKRGQPSDHMTIYATTGGIVIQKEGVEGMYVQTGTRIYTIADLSHVWVMLEAYESDLLWLRYGQKVEFTTESYPGDVFAGRISFIEPFLNERTRSVGVRVNVSNENGRLKPGMFVRALVRAQVASEGKVMDPELAGKWMCPMHPEVVQDEPGSCDVCEMPLETVESIGYAPAEPVAAPLVIPASAPLLTGRRAVVYVKVESEEGPTFEGKEVVLGPRAGEWYVVRGGLKEGEQVVTQGNFKLDSELQIRAQPRMMSPGGVAPSGTGQEGQGRLQKVSVPPAFRKSLRLLAVSLDAVELASRRADLTAIQIAYRMLAQSLQSVDRDVLEGPARKEWEDIAEALQLDAVEGENAQDLSQARSVLDRLRRDRRKLSTAFGPLATVLAGGEEDFRLGWKDLPQAFRSSVARLFDSYARLADRLASDDLEGAKKAVDGVQKALQGVKPAGLETALKRVWLDRRHELTKACAALPAKDLNSIREGFLPLSDAMAKTLRRFGPTDGRAVHLFHCSMAFGGRGGSWLAEGREVRNPYYGSEMIKCGTLKDTLRLPRPAADEDKSDE